MIPTPLPKLTVHQVKAIIGPRRGPTVVDARAVEDLRLPVIGYTDLLATMRGYRKQLGLAQRELDQVAGLDDGYVGKLEVDIRRAVNDSWWSWMGALKLVMLLVPATDVRGGHCPCCGARK